MRDSVSEKISAALVSEKIKARQRGFLTLAGVVVLLMTVYALILPAVTMTNQTFCGHEEHVHSDACTEMVLLCGYEEAEVGEDAGVVTHLHSDACYTTASELACGLEESEGHIHSVDCYTRILTCTDTVEDHEHVEGCYADELTCGLEEFEGHSHSDACYTTISELTCGLEVGAAVETVVVESAEKSVETHVHTDACYEKRQVCELEEHGHTLECYADKDADVETASEWEATLPDDEELTGVWADDLLLVAKSQLGYAESTSNYVVLEDGETIKGYTRYGAWYGDAYGDWCAMFVSFCLHYAGVAEELMPQDANCQNWIEALSDEEDFGYYVESNGDFTPMPGDLVFFDWDADGMSDHVGIVLEYAAATEDAPAKVKIIEGNASDAVAECEYDFADETIMGFAMLPTNPTELAVLEGTTELVPEESESTAEPDYESVLANGDYFYASKESEFPAYYQYSSYGVAYDVHSFVLISSAELEDGEWEPNVTQWSGKADANYIVAYCADDRTTTSPVDPDSYRSYTIDNSRFTSDEQQRKIAAIIGNSYPFLSASEARERMVAAGVTGASECSEHELTTAAQWAVWATVETVSHLEDSDICDVELPVEGDDYETYLRQTLNPLEPAAPLTEETRERIVAAKEWLCSLIEPIELEVTRYTPEVVANEDGTYELKVTVSLNREIEMDEIAEFSLVAGAHSTELAQLPAGESAFAVSLEGLTEAELADATVNLTVSGAHMQAYFFDSQHYQDMVSGNWEYFEDDLSFDLGLDYIDVAVTKVWTESDPVFDSVEVQLMADGSPYGNPVTLSAANDWHYVWEDLNRYSVTEITKDEADRVPIEYAIMEIPLEGYYSSDLTVENFEGVEKVLQWQEVETFIGAGKYVFVSDTGALKAAYNENPPSNWPGNHFITLSPVNLSSATVTGSAVIWNAKEYGSGYSLESEEYPGYYMNGNSERVTTAPSAQTFENGLLGCGGYYFGGFWSNGYQYYTTNMSKVMYFKLYKLVEVELPAAEKNFVLTNSSIPEGSKIDISVTKAWEGRLDEVYPESVTVQLMQEDIYDGEGVQKPYGYPIVLNAENDWSYTWANLPEYMLEGDAYRSIEYSVVEVETPEGYEAVLSAAVDNSFAYTLTNSWNPETETVTIRKVAAGFENTLLPGAVFDVYLATNDVGDVIPGTLDAKGIKEGSFTVGSDGTAEYEFVAGEIYYLVETKAPAGYNKLTEAIGFVVSRDESGVVLTEIAGGGWFDVTSGETAVITVKNDSGYELPETGGIGSHWFAAGGLLLIAAAGLVLHRRRRVEGVRV